MHTQLFSWEEIKPEITIPRKKVGLTDEHYHTCPNTSISRSPHLHRPFGYRDLLPLRHAGRLHERSDQRLQFETREQFAVPVQELFAPAAVVVEDFVELRLAGNLDDAFVEDVGRAESLR